MTATFRKLWKREYVQTVAMIVLIVVVVFGLWFGSQFALGTSYPALAVASGSMCMVQHMDCDGVSHPFGRTLHVGDLIIIQGLDPRSISDAYPDSDIIVFHKPRNSPALADDLIVHRVIRKEEINGIVYFVTKGDGNGVNWPADPSGERDNWGIDYRGTNYSLNGMVSEKLVVGKVILRIPWVGHMALFMRNPSGIYVIFALLMLLVVVEFAVPMFRRKETETAPTPEPEQAVEKPPET